MDSGNTIFSGNSKIVDVQGYTFAHVFRKFAKGGQFIWQKEVGHLAVKGYSETFKAVASVSHVSFYPAHGGVIHWWIATGSKVPERISCFFSQFPDSFSRQFHDYYPAVFEFMKPILCRFYKHY